jgi:hypothetical protein
MNEKEFDILATLIAVVIVVCGAAGCVFLVAGCEKTSPCPQDYSASENAHRWAEKMGLTNPTADCGADEHKCHKALCNIAWGSVAASGRKIRTFYCSPSGCYEK